MHSPVDYADPVTTPALYDTTGSDFYISRDDDWFPDAFGKMDQSHASASLMVMHPHPQTANGDALS